MGDAVHCQSPGEFHFARCNDFECEVRGLVHDVNQFVRALAANGLKLAEFLGEQVGLPFEQVKPGLRRAAEAVAAVAHFAYGGVPAKFFQGGNPVYFGFEFVVCSFVYHGDKVAEVLFKRNVNLYGLWLRGFPRPMVIVVPLS